MQISINAYWFYGWYAHDIGKYQYNNETRQTTFHWRGQVHPSSWCACVELRNELYKRQDYNTHEYKKVFAGNLGSENMVGIRVEAETGRINEVLDPAILDQMEKDMKETLRICGGFDVDSLPKPRLFFAVDVGDE